VRAAVVLAARAERAAHALGRVGAARVVVRLDVVADRRRSRSPTRPRPPGGRRGAASRRGLA
jgi:hypothetical protein